MKLTGPASAVGNARRLRRELSLPEAMLWTRLRGSPSGIRFRRQHPAGPYVLDFFCFSASLAIEIDGISHNMGDAPARDDRRDAWLASQGLRVLRIPASEVLRDANRVADSIIALALDHPLHHRKSDGPPPPMGEDFQERPWNT